jgi:hypothetical protein
LISFTGANANISGLYVTTGSGAHDFSTGGNAGTQQLKVAHTASAVNYVQITGNATGGGPFISAQGSDTNISMYYLGKGNAGHVFTSGNGGNIQTVISNTTSSVNWVQFTGAATGNSPIISAQGSDANAGLWYYSKGFGGHRFYGYNGSSIFGQFYAAQSNPVNYAQIGASSSGNAVSYQAQGSDTNISLAIQPKGTGALQAQQTDSTATGGNARGANAVDWQTSRDISARVASGSFAVITGGRGNTCNGFNAVVSGGGFNSASVQAAFVGGGEVNTASGTYSAIVGGQSNTAAGFYSTIGGGQLNSGTSGSAVTTQSATMNGTTAVTLSGSNASIKVGQYITGTSIASDTYVSAISGTSLTLSKVASGSSTSTLSFYTPHGVVVGGGNNTATGSYSFIGGGGDAGTAGNRNVASGDWSVVGGGRGNVASGVASFVGGGGTSPQFGVFPNIASGLGSSVVGGFANTAPNQGAFVGGGFNNVANGVYSAVLGGVAGSTRSITGYQVFSANDNPLNTIGGNQAAMLVLSRQTTDATPTVLTSVNAAANTVNQVILPNNSAYFFTGEVVAGVTGGGNTKGWTIEGVIKRGANAASTALVGTPTVTSTYADAGASTWVIAVTADTTNGGLAVTFTGQAATTIRTVCRLNTTEMTF